MSRYVGLDVSQKETHICIVDEKNKLIWQGKCLTSPEAIADKISKHAATPDLVGLETGALATWLWNGLKGLGLPVVCMEARYANAALKANINKTDKKDAQGLARLLQTGFFKEVQIKSYDAHKVRAALGARATLVRTIVDFKNQIRGLLKVKGTILTRNDLARLDEVLDPNDFHDESVRVLYDLLQVMQTRLNDLDKALANNAHQDARTNLLMSVPGVGPVTATAFLSTIDDPNLFQKSRTVGAYIGLTPKRWQSGETDYNGRISKAGDGLLRAYLYEASNILLNRCKSPSPLAEWAQRIKTRSGFKKAKVALARKLAVIMHKMLITGEVYNPTLAAEAA